MSATDELRRMLDERGVGWVCYGYENHTWWNGWHAENRPSVNGLFVKLETVCTPEQAIAATLGGGMLTAEHVREALILHMPHREYYSIEQTDAWQAIADELNARAERTCHIEMYPMGLHEEDGEASICSACRVAIDEDVYYCPNCGARVVSE